MRYLAAPAILAALCLSACAKRPAPAPVEPPAPAVVEAPAPVVEPPVVVAPQEPKTKAPRAPATTFTALFAFDSDEVRPIDQRRLRAFCTGLAGRPVAIEAYTSAERSGKYTEAASQAYNLHILSPARANATAFHARVAGCNVVSVEGKGETWQFGRSLPTNRRVIIKAI